MVYDTVLAERVRARLAARTAFEERAMFGGLAFMVNTHMACGIIHDDLLVRVGVAGHDAAIARGAREMDFTGRPMRSMVLVPGEDLDDDVLAEWVEGAVSFAGSEPPKPPKQTRRRERPRPLEGGG